MTFTPEESLAHYLFGNLGEYSQKPRRLISNEPHLAERLEVHSINAIGHHLFKVHFGQPRIVARPNFSTVEGSSRRS
jgi:hypothetical protein